MYSLKYEMRKLFEEKEPITDLYGMNMLEEGLLQKILNLSAANLPAFDNRIWDIITVKSQVYRKKLYTLSDDNPDVANAKELLLVMQNTGFNIFHEIDRLADHWSPEGGNTYFRPPETKRMQALSESNAENSFEASLQMLALSVMYSAKYYCIDFRAFRNLDFYEVKKKLNIDGTGEPVMLICLSYFDNSTACSNNSKPLNKYNLMEI
jgi:hypothetical protein